MAKATFIYFVNQQSALCKILIVFQSLSNLAALVGKVHLRCELADIMIWLEINGFLSMDVGLQPGSSGRSMDVVMAFICKKNLKKLHII